MDIRDPITFARWWQYRNAPGDDRKIVELAIQAGLVRRDGGLLRLTEAGKALRQRTLASKRRCPHCGGDLYDPPKPKGAA